MCRCDAFAVWDSGLTGVNVSLCLGYRGVRRGGGVRWGFSGDQRLVWWWSTGWCLAEVCCGCTGGSRTSSLLPFGAYCGLESYRVIVLRGQASLPQVRWWAGIVGAELARDGGAAVWSDTASSFFAGKPRSHRFGGGRALWELSLLAMGALRFGVIPRHRLSRASPAPTGAGGVAVMLRHRSSRASLAPTGSVVGGSTALSFIAGKPGSHRRRAGVDLG